MYSHHSHSGDYVAHGVDPLNDIIAEVERLNFKVYCLTEHIPRINAKYLYSEEFNEGTIDADEALLNLRTQFNRFMEHATIIKAQSKSSTKFIIGSEIEGCDDEHIDYCNQMLKENALIVKFVIGSIHHVNSIAIDYDQEEWFKAVRQSNNNIKQFLIDYFNLQYKLLVKVKPLVVGHFDLYKLYLPEDLKIDKLTGQIIENDDSIKDPNNIVKAGDLILESNWGEVQNLIIRNLKYIKEYNGLIEINTSALRKKLKEPYPNKQICKLVSEYCDNRFVLSDDAHAVSHVGVAYRKALDYITQDIKLKGLYYLTEDEENSNQLKIQFDKIEDIQKDTFWNRIKDK